jgi:putative endonuclease
MPECFVYILTNKNRSTLYIGVTNDLARRVWEHREKAVPGFSADYSLAVLLYYEVFPDAPSAIAREKQLKGWRREKKVGLIERANPRWRDLSVELEQGEIVRGPSTASPPPSPAGDSAQDDGGGPDAGPEFL